MEVVNRYIFRDQSTKKILHAIFLVREQLESIYAHPNRKSYYYRIVTSTSPIYLLKFLQGRNNTWGTQEIAFQYFLGFVKFLEKKDLEKLSISEYMPDTMWKDAELIDNWRIDFYNTLPNLIVASPRRNRMEYFGLCSDITALIEEFHITFKEDCRPISKAEFEKDLNEEQQEEYVEYFKDIHGSVFFETIEAQYSLRFALTKKGLPILFFITPHERL